MYELRFVEKLSLNSWVEPIKVLQFRTKDKHRESSTAVPLPFGWSDWKDVPLVKEEGIE